MRSTSDQLDYNWVSVNIVSAVLVSFVELSFSFSLTHLFLQVTYGSKLVTITHQMIIISQVAGLARQIENDSMGGKEKPRRKSRNSPNAFHQWNFRDFAGDTRPVMLRTMMVA
jgi:hypothetical protein